MLLHKTALSYPSETRVLIDLARGMKKWNASQIRVFFVVFMVQEPIDHSLALPAKGDDERNK